MHSARSDALLLTGATGFVGTAVLVRFLDRTDRPVVAPVRAASREAATDRLRAALAEVVPPGEVAGYLARCTAVPADLCVDGLGLDPCEYLRLARRCDEIVHCAAAVAFDQPLADARLVNAGGAERVAAFANAAMVRGDGLRRVVHVSTAYTAGDHAGTYHEHDVASGAPHRNTYEQTKHEAELRLRGWSPELPLQIVRPSIVVGERRGGWTRSFNVLYWPLRMFAGGRLPVIPALADAPVDVVPVDYVADAVLGLADAPPGTYHAVAGTDASSVGEVIALAAAHFGRPAPEVVAPETLTAFSGPLSPAQQRALDRARVYFPYFAMRVRFDDRVARAHLEPRGVRSAPLGSYFGDLMAYAERASWGRPAHVVAA
jgi:thioester reductase-like protein